MNIEARKISIARMLFNIQKEDVLDKIEALLNRESVADIEIPQWQIEETRKRSATSKEEYLSQEEFEAKLKGL